MATIQRFEDLLCWQKARLLTKGVYTALKGCHDNGFRDQIQRAAVSVMSNLAEGFERGTKNEFLNYLYIAKGSAGEVRAQLYVALDVCYINMEVFQSLNSLAVECSRLIESFAQKVKLNERQGMQYKRVDKVDPLEEILAPYPELYERRFGKKPPQ